VVAAEACHGALGPDVDLGDIGFTAEALDRHHLQQLVGLLRQGAEAVD
jgi:hypothetical protein